MVNTSNIYIIIIYIPWFTTIFLKCSLRTSIFKLLVICLSFPDLFKKFQNYLELLDFKILSLL